MSPPPRTSGLFAAGAAVLALVASGCANRLTSETFYEDPQIQIHLQQQEHRGEVIDQGYSHPVAIAPVRMAHILSRLDVRTEDGKKSERVAALPTEALYPLADHLSKALSQADPTQAVAVYYIRRHKRLGIFDRRYLYSFLTYAVDNTLYIHLSRVDWEIEKPNGATRRERLPVPKVGDHPMKFRAIASRGMALADSQTLAVDWRNDVFRRPTRTSIGPDGRVVRRTILMESEIPEEPEATAEDIAPVVLPQNISSSTLRDLADLEDLRSRGEITEAEYNERRRNILDEAAAEQQGNRPDAGTGAGE
jgi:hypothetical protein